MSQPRYIVYDDNDISAAAVLDQDNTFSGDIIFSGAGSGLVYGEIYGHDVAVDITLAAQDTDYQITAFDTVGSQNLMTGSVANDDITVSKTGVYKISYHMSTHSHASNDYVFVVKINNGASEFVNTKAHTPTATAGEVTPISGCGIISLTANDTVELWVRRTDGGAVSKTLTIDHITMNLVQVGG